MDDSNKATDLCEAAGKGDLSTVTRLVAEGVDINSRVLGGVTAVMKASANGHLNVIKFLLERGANVNQTDRYGYNALLWAVDKAIANLDTIKYLVEHQASLKAKSKDTGYTPLHWAAAHGNLDIVKYLVEKGAEISEKTTKNETPVHLAAANNQINVLEYFINERFENFDILQAAEKGYLGAVRYFIDVKKKSATTTGPDGRNILHRATYAGSLDTVKYLIEEKKVNVNVASTGERRVPLHEASGPGHFSIVTYLVGKKGDINARDLNGRTPVYWAVELGHLDIVKFYVDVNGANVFQNDNYGNTLLHATQSLGTLDVLKYLVEDKKLNINARNDEGSTTLLKSLSKGHPQSFYYLFKERNADFEIADNGGYTCLHHAAVRGYLDIVKLLVDRGADINAKTTDKFSGRTPLYFAAHGNKLDVVRYFVDEKGADVFQKDDPGNTLLHAAGWTGGLDVFKYLVEEKKLDINEKNKEGHSPLNRAIANRQEKIAQYLRLKGALKDRRRRSVPDLPTPETPVNSAYRHYSVINHVAHFARDTAFTYLISSSKPLANTAADTMKFESNIGSFGGMLLLLNVVYRKFFALPSIERTSLQSEICLSPPQLIERYIDPNATSAVEGLFNFGDAF